MAKSAILDQTFHVITERFIATGEAPNYAQLAAELGVSPAEGQTAIRKLFKTLGFPGWFEPKTDNIASFAPFNNIPSNHRITIDGEQKWFAQWAFESLAVCWLFPGKTVRIDSTCPDCGEPVRVDVKDGKIEHEEPEGLIGHVSVPFGQWIFKMAYSWSTMNFFRSEEHVRNLKGFNEKKMGGIIALNDLMRLFSGAYFKKRRDPDYFSNMGTYMPEFIATLDSLENAGNFWRLKWFERLGIKLGLKLGLM